MESQRAVGALNRLQPAGKSSRSAPHVQSKLVTQRRRWESNPLQAALQAAAVPSGSSVNSQMSSPGIGPGPRPSRGRVRIRHTPRTRESRVNSQNVRHLFVSGSRLLTLDSRPFNTSPRSRTSSCSFEGCRAIRHTRKAIRQSIPTWTRTRAWSFGDSNAIRYTVGMLLC